MTPAPLLTPRVFDTDSLVVTMADVNADPSGETVLRLNTMPTSPNTPNRRPSAYCAPNDPAKDWPDAVVDSEREGIVDDELVLDVRVYAQRGLT
jgi:hypothetical protein